MLFYWHNQHSYHLYPPTTPITAPAILGFGYQPLYLTPLSPTPLIPVLYPLSVAPIKVSPKRVLVTPVYQPPLAMTLVSALTIYSKPWPRPFGQASVLTMTALPRRYVVCNYHPVALMAGSSPHVWDSPYCLTTGTAISTVRWLADRSMTVSVWVISMSVVVN